MKYIYNATRVWSNHPDGFDGTKGDDFPIAIKIGEKTIPLFNEIYGSYLPPNFKEEMKPSASGYWNYGEGIKVRYRTGGSKPSCPCGERWFCLEILAPKESELLFPSKITN